MAIALGKPVHLLGARENLFYWHRLVSMHRDLAAPGGGPREPGAFDLKRGAAAYPGEGRLETAIS